jgi:hypothetical protein
MESWITKEEFESFKHNLLKMIKAKGQKPHVRRLVITPGMLESGKFPLKTYDMRVQFLDCGGASRTVKLPAESASKNLYFIIYNISDASEDLIIEDPATNVICTISQDEGAHIWCWKDPADVDSQWRGFVGGKT